MSILLLSAVIFVFENLDGFHVKGAFTFSERQQKLEF